MNYASVEVEKSISVVAVENSICGIIKVKLHGALHQVHHCRSRLDGESLLQSENNPAWNDSVC